MGENQTIFALDIGTRSVMGLLAKSTAAGTLEIIDWEQREHTSRSMLDGQIHDVEAVAKLIAQVKTALEERNQPLQRVAVAAAGRALLTRHGKASLPPNAQHYLTKEEVHHCELAAVQAAQAALQQELPQQRNYYSVGYSIYHYYLDGEIIGNPVDQRGEKLEVDVIATFLPQVVVDSLLAVLERVELQLHSLTLEPIAAIEAIIPPTMRRLNVALVDIGAGTSDIAITADGTITAYGMVPLAGDEITDMISQCYLLDFPIAEQVKRQLNQQERIAFQDILGLEMEETRAKIIETIQPEIERLAEAISMKIMELNGKSPQAVMLIGGGSLTPQLAESIASLLHLPPQRVAVRDATAIQAIDHSFIQDKGPDWITPLGITMTALHHPLNNIQVSLNGQALSLFELRPLQVSDALLAAGVNFKHLHGRPGLSIQVTVDGKNVWLRGTHGKPPTILRNEEPAALTDPLQPGDILQVTPGADGENGGGLIEDLPLSLAPLELEVNGEWKAIPPRILRNGVEVSPLEPVADRDQIRCEKPSTIGELLNRLETEQAPTLRFQRNGEWLEYPLTSYRIEVNGRAGNEGTPIAAGDRIQFLPTTDAPPTLLDFLPSDWEQHLTIQVTYNDQPVQLFNPRYQVERNGEIASWDEAVQTGDQVNYREDPERYPVFSDVFRYVEVELEPPQGRTRLVLMVDGEAANFQTPLHQGSRLQLFWE